MLMLCSFSIHDCGSTLSSHGLCLFPSNPNHSDTHATPDASPSPVGVQSFRQCRRRAGCRLHLSLSPLRCPVAQSGSPRRPRSSDSSHSPRIENLDSSRQPPTAPLRHSQTRHSATAAARRPGQ